MFKGKAKVSSFYSNAFFRVASSQGKLLKINNDMLKLSSLLSSNVVSNFMFNPNVAFSVKEKKLRDIINNDFDKISLEFMIYLLKNRLWYCVINVINDFIKLYKSHNGIIVADIFTACKLTDELKGKMQKFVKQKFYNCKEVELVEHLDHNIIGGFLLRVGDIQVDMTIRSKLNKLFSVDI